jgi:CRISPR-associated endonuclease/helicase Cas3
MYSEQPIISHLYQDEQTGQWHIQDNDAHQAGVARLAETFGQAFGCGSVCRLMGLWHDKGKEQQAFQTYISVRSGYKKLPYSSEHPRHAYVGALLIEKLQPQYFYLLGMIMAAHHSGLKDLTADYVKELRAPGIPTDVTLPCNFTPEKPTLIGTIARHPEDYHHFMRMLYSCLVDADYLDTETFMQGRPRTSLYGQRLTPQELLAKLEGYLSDLKQKSEPTPLNQLRNQIQELCRNAADGPQGFYSLTVPTGGGKTLSGLLWALRHAVAHGLDRVIIAIPYTSIIVQTAQVLRRIFGADNVLEHHSAFDADNLSNAEEQEVDRLAMQQRLASENWDSPIVVTTNVQLFESIYSSRPSRCRKLHNIARSVLILDEAQMLPLQHMQPVLNALKSYQRLFSCSVLLTTASQPVLSDSQLRDLPRPFAGLEQVTEIIPSDMQLHDRLRRVSIHIDSTASDYNSVAARMMQYHQVLCIVNTRRDAMEIYTRLPEDNDAHIHLSRMMCSAHLSETLNAICRRLSDPAQPPLRVVATQLIEAGVDVDFQTVMRQEAGLDSILQAAGRCNREGHRSTGDTYVFRLDRPLPRGYITQANDARLSLPEASDWLAPEVMTQYFRQLYSRCSTFDKADMTSLLVLPHPAFESADEVFRLIEDEGRDVVVNYGEAMSLVERVRREPMTYALRRQLAAYSVHIHDRDFAELVHAGLVEEVLTGIFVVSDPAQYSSRCGLSVHNHWPDEIMII